jgi:hypothetical protein
MPNQIRNDVLDIALVIKPALFTDKYLSFLSMGRA